MDINEVLTRYGIEPPARLPIKAVYHDPCHLLRGQGIKNQPRELITQVVDLVEMPAVCCGSGGGVRSGVPDEAAALAENRRKEIEKAGADIVISSCPFCEFHIQEHTDRPVKNITTVLLEGYREKDRKGAQTPLLLRFFFRGILPPNFPTIRPMREREGLAPLAVAADRPHTPCIRYTLYQHQMTFSLPEC